MDDQTQKDVSLLSDGELKFKVAELLGWTWPVELPSLKPGGFGYFKDEYEFRTIPDYCNDLNAMHEAETWFMQNNELPAWNDYVSKLVDICGHNDPEPYRIKTVADFYCFAFHATARQRAEAFVKTLTP